VAADTKLDRQSRKKNIGTVAALIETRHVGSRRLEPAPSLRSGRLSAAAPSPSSTSAETYLLSALNIDDKGRPQWAQTKLPVGKPKTNSFAKDGWLQSPP